MEKLKMHSPDFTQDNIARLAELFPNCVTESQSNDGSFKKVIDFDQLRQELSDHVVDGPRERYHVNWPGKREALLTSSAAIAKTLRPLREESIDFDTTRNLFVEGDNLDALKLLQETYLNKIKMIYIDPPYNTGNDFIYNDDFTDNMDSYFKRSNQQDSEGNRLVINNETNGRFHSEWMSMMYPRLRLAKNLLSDDGTICISIDDHEVATLRKICDEVFGEDNFIGTLVWQKRYVSNVTAKWLSDMHDYVLLYGRSKTNVAFNSWKRTEEQEAAYKNPDDDPRGVWRAQDLSASKPYSAGQYEITGPSGKTFSPPPNRYWRCNERQFNAWNEDNRIWWGVNGDARPMLKSFLLESDRGITPHTWWDYSFAGHNKEATLEVKKLFDGNAPFDTPKPVKLMKRLIELITEEDSVILDFFAGSCTLAHAVMESNADDGGNRRHIMIQIPEKCDEDSTPFKSGYRSIADIGKERIRRAGKMLLAGNSLVRPGLDVGFRVLKVDTSNMKDVYYNPDTLDKGDLFEHVENIKEDRTPEDLLFQVLLDWGVDLSLPIAQEEIEGKTVFFVDENALVACFDTGVSEDLVKQLAARKPLRVVFRDAGFADDSVKINVEQIFKLMSPDTEVKAI